MICSFSYRESRHLPPPGDFATPAIIGRPIVVPPRRPDALLQFMRLRANLSVTLSLVTLAACSSGMGSIEHSKLPSSTPPVNLADLTNALPKPMDYGPGWKLNTSAGPVFVGDDADYLWNFATLGVFQKCKGADFRKAGIYPSGQYAAEQLDGPIGAIRVTVAIDSPAHAADRMTFLRKAFTKCGKTVKSIHIDEKTVDTYHVLPTPKVRADEALAVRVDRRWPDFRWPENWAVARAGALVVALTSKNNNPTPMLSPTMERARRQLHL